MTYLSRQCNYVPLLSTALAKEGLPLSSLTALRRSHGPAWSVCTIMFSLGIASLSESHTESFRDLFLIQRKVLDSLHSAGVMITSPFSGEQLF